MLRRLGTKAAAWRGAGGRSYSVDLRSWSRGYGTGARAAAEPQKKRQYLHEPSLRVRVVPMFTDNYGASCRVLWLSVGTH